MTSSVRCFGLSLLSCVLGHPQTGAQPGVQLVDQLDGLPGTIGTSQESLVASLALRTELQMPRHGPAPDSRDSAPASAHGSAELITV